MQQPTIGRIVHVTQAPTSDNNYADTAPAIITRVFGGNCVNVRVLHDGPPVAEGRQDWLTSIPLEDDEEGARALGLTHVAFWPPHAPARKPDSISGD